LFPRSSNSVQLVVKLTHSVVALQTLWSAKECHGAISDLKYSPDNAYLAVASHDQVVDVYSVAKGYKRVARLSGHSATVRHVDWSADSSVLMTNCAGYEALYWSPRSCKPLMTDQRDTPWASWTCVLGFPVMGIWPDGSDGTDINAVDRSAAGE
jgi:WD40 repeat protein